MNNTDIDISEINRNLQESYIHYNPNRVDYTISDLEINMLEQTGNNIWKDAFLATFGLGVPTLLNGFFSLSKLTEQQSITIEIFINLLIGGISTGICIICLIVWQTNSKKFSSVIEDIKNKPRYRIPQQNTSS